MKVKCVAICWVIFFLLCVVVQAIPTIPVVSSVSSNGAVFTNAGAVSPCWYKWGPLGDGKELWKTSNTTATGGICTVMINGSPLNGGTIYYVASYDTTGNSTLTASFTTLAVVPNTATTYGNIYQNVSETGFNMPFIISNTLAPYAWVSPMSFVWGFLFLIIYVGFWIRGRGILISAILGFATGSLFLYSNMGLSLGIPVEFTAIAQGIAYASMAGIILSLVKR